MQQKGMNKPKYLKNLRGVLAAGSLLLVLVILAWVFRARILTGIADGLIVSDSPQPADIIFLLNGDYNTRPFRAAELYAQKLAPLVVIAHAENTPAEELGLVPNSTDVAVGVMEKKGVPPADITVLPMIGGVTSTFDEAAVLRNYVQTHPGLRRVLLVTSLFHTRRTGWIFQRELSGLGVTLTMIAVPYSDFDRTNWWKNEAGMITLNNEYIKLMLYYFKYR
jgi:uncharacterized SAM-binding protein YcdF (DUF218 family)